MNPVPDSVPNLPVFQVDVNNPLPTSEVFISQASGFFMPPLVGFFVACISALILWKIIKAFYQ